nr:glycosyl transferase, family 1 [Tanacetum cinerariifolium]
TVFQDTFRKMYALSSYVEALTPMPEDGGHWSALHSWLLRIKGLFGLTYLGDMGAEMYVLGYGSRGMVQRMWFKGCGSGVVLYLVALYGVWFRCCGSRVLVKRVGWDLDLLSLRSNGYGSSIHAYVGRMSAWLLQFFSQNGILWLRFISSTRGCFVCC